MQTKLIGINSGNRLNYSGFVKKCNKCNLYTILNYEHVAIIYVEDYINLLKR